jgi:hypothetical protein
MNDADRHVFRIPSVRTWTKGGALRMEGQSVPDLEQMDVHRAVRVGKTSMTTWGTNTPKRTG